MPKNLKRKANVKKKKRPTRSSRKVDMTRKKKLVSQEESSGETLSEMLANEIALDASETGSEVVVSTIQPGDADMEENGITLEDLADVSQERASIISIVKGLEGQVETAFKLKEVLEDELNAVQQKLSEQLDSRAHLEARVKTLEARAALAEQLREDISFAEEERNKFADKLAEIQPQLEAMTAERDSLAEQRLSAEGQVKKLGSEKMALEAQVMNLKDKINDDERLLRELAEASETNRNLREQLEGLARHLESSEASKDALERDIVSAKQTERSLREEVEGLREKAMNADSRTADLRIQLEDQQVVSRRLMEDKTHLESDLKMLNIKFEACKNELDAFRSALRDIRSEASLTSGRVRQRYFKPVGKK